MVINSKNKGSAFEREATKVLNELIEDSKWYKIPMSGSVGTRIGLPSLSSDVIGSVEGFSKDFRVECKVGYNNSDSKEVKQMTIKKDWIDKVIEEAKKTYSIPMLFCKFDNVRSGTKYFVILDSNTFSDIVNELSNLQKELELTYEENERLRKGANELE